METRQDWLLLFLSGAAVGAQNVEGLDPVRIQKGMFLVSMRGPVRDVYTFRPYNWGPFSSAIYADLEHFEREGLIRGQRVPGQSWKRYETTDKGDDRARMFADTLEPPALAWLAAARDYVASRSFTQLLREIYARYPSYAVNSLLEQQ